MLAESLTPRTAASSTAAAPARREYRLTLRLEPTDAGFEPEELLSFRQRFDTVRGTLPLRSAVSTLHPVSRAVFGTERMSLLRAEMGSTKSIDPSTGVAVRASAAVQLYLPVLSLFGPSLGAAGNGSSSGCLLSADPRSAFAFQFGVSGVAASRLFFLDSAAGATDEGYFNGDQNVSYVLRLGLPVGSGGGAEDNWAPLFAHYRAVNSWMRAGQELPPGLTNPSWPNEQSGANPTRAALHRFTRLHANRIGVGNIFCKIVMLSRFACCPSR